MVGSELNENTTRDVNSRDRTCLASPYCCWSCPSSDGWFSIRAQSNRPPGGIRDLYHEYIANKSAAHVWCFHSNMDYNLQGMFQAPWHVELRQIWKQTGAKPRTSNLIMQVGLDNNNSLCKCLSLLHNLTMGEIKRTSVWVSDVE